MLYAYDTTGRSRSSNLTNHARRGLQVRASGDRPGRHGAVAGRARGAGAAAQDVRRVLGPSLPPGHLVDLLPRAAARARRPRSSAATSTGCRPSPTGSTGRRRSAGEPARCRARRLRRPDRAAVARARRRARRRDDPRGRRDDVTVELTTTSGGPAPAFFLRADVRRGARRGEVLPIRWSDNGRRWPGERVTAHRPLPRRGSGRGARGDRRRLERRAAAAAAPVRP